ncbi:MAG: 30S ribosomal protein S20 [Candidatus Pacebacteria bacterium]|nr:30S ribosomal protein S20 [Candidatus Paceibacterota bacterium]
MPKIQSARKALRQNARRRAQNSARRNALKKVVKEFKKLTTEKQLSEAQRALEAVYAMADKVAKTHAIAKNKASRVKSRMATLLKKASSR